MMNLAPHPRFPTFFSGRKKILTRESVALLSLAAFILFNTLKLTVFNHLIVSNHGELPRLAAIIPAFFVRLAFFIFLFTLFLRIRFRFPLVVLYLLQTLYVTVNLMYYLSFQGYLHVSQYIGLFSEAWDLVTHSALPCDLRSLFIVIDLPFLIGLTFFYPRLHALCRSHLFKPVFYGFSVFFIVYFYRWEVPVESPARMMNNRYSSDVSVVKKYGLLTFNIVDLLNYRDVHSRIKRLNYGPVFAVSDTSGIRRNLLMLQVESLDAHIINCRHRKRLVTPFLNGLSKESIFFPYTLSYHAGGSTSDCEFSTLSSVEPLHNYPSIKLRNYDYANSLVKRFKRNGYEPLAFHGNRGTYFNRSFAYKKIGFQTFYDMFAMGIKEKGWGIPDDTVFTFALSRLETQKQPFFYYIITMTSHEPFTLVKRVFHDHRFDNIKDGAKRNYYNSMAYVDRELKRIVTSVRESHPNTVIFIYGDHTPTLPKCSYQKAMIRHNDRVLEFVPLFILTPDKKVHYEKKYAASFLDIAPTALAASGITDSIRTHGLNLFDLPLREKEIPLRGQIYSRKQLYSMVAKKR